VRWLARQGLACPVRSTVHDILRRHGRITAPGSGGSAYQRFERLEPNLLWQMDFKGHIALSEGGRCHPLTILDDHSRYAIGLEACANEQAATVRGRLEQVFRRYGLPEAFFVDNGTPWGDASGQRWTKLGVWLLKLGVAVLHSRPYHPQSRGKSERFHRTLKAEVLALQRFRDLATVQRALDAWRTVYNLDRPHQALGQDVPASRYRPSTRAMPEQLPVVEYDEREIVRRVGTTKGYISFKGRLWRVPEAFCGECLAIRPLPIEGRYSLCFGAHQIATLDLTADQCVGDVSGQVSAMSPG
jgi:transposase InsO family protein